VMRETVKLTTMKLILALVLAGSVVSVQAALAAGPTAFVCKFGGTISIDDGEAKPSSIQMKITFADVDWASGSAQMIGNQGTTSVMVARGVSGIHFLEMTPAGIFITVTTVFDTPMRGEVVADQGVNIERLGRGLDAARAATLVQVRQAKAEVARLLAGGGLLAVHSPNARGGPLSPMARHLVGVCEPRYP